MHKTCSRIHAAVTIGLMIAIAAWAPPSHGAPGQGDLLAQVPSGQANMGPVSVAPVSVQPGDTVTVSVWGTPKSTVTFDLGSHTGIAMPDNAGGTVGGNYIGKYKVAPDDHFNNQSVVVHLVTSGGQRLNKPAEMTVTVVPKLEIKSLDFDPKGPFKYGDTITFTVQGTTRAKVIVEVGGQPYGLRETGAGVYTSTIRFSPTGTSDVPFRATIALDTRTIAKDGGVLHISK